MKKIYFLIAALFLFTTTKSQILNIPDVNFKAKLLQASFTNTIAKNLTGSYFKIDTNNDGEIEANEALQVSYLSLSGISGSNYRIASMEGIASFSNIKSLGCVNNVITTLDVSMLANLTDLNCNKNQISTLITTGLVNLQTLHCSNNQLTSLDVSYLTQLRSLRCSFNLLTTLDVSGLANLFEIDCSHNALVSLNASTVPSLTSLTCSWNQMTSLNLAQSTNIRHLYCGVNDLQTIDLTGLTNLTILNVGNNSLTSLDLTSCVNLQQLDCDANSFTSLNLAPVVQLTRLMCNGNHHITNLDVSTLTNLAFLDVGNMSQLTTLNVTPLTNLTSLFMTNTPIPAIDLSVQVNILTDLSVSGTTTTSPGISSFINLDSLILSGYIPTTIDLSLLSHLESFHLSNSHLVSLDLSYCHQLTMVNIMLNQELIYLNMKTGIPITATGGRKISSNPNLIYICCNEGDIDFIRNNLLNAYNPALQLNSYCSFAPGGLYNTILGTTHFDATNDGCSVSDPVFNNIRMGIDDGTTSGATYTIGLGSYSFYVQRPNITLTPTMENPEYFNITPPNATLNFPQNNSTIQNQDFCITANGTHPDLEITLWPLQSARPGFQTSYSIVYKNKGNQMQSGIINFAFDDAILDFVNSNPPISNQAINALNWNFTNLLPFETRKIIMTLQINSPTDVPPVNSGTILDFTTLVDGSLVDDTPADNIFLLHQTVVNSFDPNDKTCLEGNTITPDMVGKEVHYMIRFENTGTANAENIVVKDMIDTAKFDINSLIPIDGSHPFLTRISDTNKVEFIFENINLPFDDANNDGYIAFKIKTKPTLVVGNSFSNTASIYFDYNFPINTNTATTTVALLANVDFAFEDYFKIYPNPANDLLNIETKQTIEVTSVNIYNTLGQIVLVIPNAQQTKSVDVSSLKTGNYFIKVNSDKGSSSVKFVKI